MEDEFATLVKSIHNARVREEYDKMRQKENSGESAYILFSCWCHAYCKDNKSIEHFKEYLLAEKITPTKPQKKYILKNFLGWKEKGELE